VRGALRYRASREPEKADASRKLPVPPGVGSQLPLVQSTSPLILGLVPRHLP